MRVTDSPEYRASSTCLVCGHRETAWAPTVDGARGEAILLGQAHIDANPGCRAPLCPYCDLPGRLMGTAERYICDREHTWRLDEV